MNFVFFIHSLASDWNHGNAHFVRGVISDLLARGHSVRAYEQKDNWSRWNLEQEHGPDAVAAYLSAYPELTSVAHDYELDEAGSSKFPTPEAIDAVRNTIVLDRMLSDADVVIVHEWVAPALVAAIGRHRQKYGGYHLLFHDTHHRVVSEPMEMEAFDLSGYDGVLAFGDVLRKAYEARRTVPRAWTWHEAADTRRFKPLEAEKTGDLVWVGNWGDDERTAELHEFLLGPVKALGLRATVHGVRYPDDAREALADAGIEYGRYLPNFRTPERFAQHKVTVHVPRRYYVTHLPGIPTIRPFEALACGIPLVCSPWQDAENLFTPGRDFLVATNGEEMRGHLEHLLENPDAAAEQAARGLETVRARHTCAHRVDELLHAIDSIG